MKKTVLIRVGSSQNIFYFKTENNIRISKIKYLDCNFNDLDETMLENVVEFIGFSRVEIASFILSKENLFDKIPSIVIGNLKPSYNFNFEEITKDNKVALFILKNDNIYLIFYENNKIMYQKYINSAFDLSNLEADLLIFKNFSNVQIASIKKILSKHE